MTAATSPAEALHPSLDDGPRVLVRLPPRLYEAVLAQARSEGRTMADVMRSGAYGYLALTALVEDPAR